MIPQSFPGRYADEHGEEPVTWRFEPAPGAPMPTYRISATVRGVEVRGYDFDGLHAVDAPAAVAAGLSLDDHGDLTSCAVSGDLPCSLEGPGGHRPGLVRFAVDLRAGGLSRAESILRLSVDVEGAILEVVDDWFEDGLLRLAAALPDGVRLRSCVTCLFSDYSPYGHSMMGILCHRDARTQYLAVKSKADYWAVPVTEEVPETYLCPEFEPRVPGTGYRG